MLRQAKRGKVRRRRYYRPILEVLEDRTLPSVSLFGPLVSGPGAQQMPSIAVDSHHPEHVVVAYMDTSLADTGHAGVGVSVTRDGGVSWQRTFVALPSDQSGGAANPVARFDDQGHVFISFMAATFLGPDKPNQTVPISSQRRFGFQSNNGVFVARSDDGGSTWNPASAVTSNLYTGSDVVFDEMPDMAVDTFPALPNGAANPNFGNLYVNWVRVYPDGQLPGGDGGRGASDIMVAVSRDGGATWNTQLETVAQLIENSPGASWIGYAQQALDPALQVTVIKDPDVAFDATNSSGRGWMFYSHITVGPEGDLYVSAFSGADFAVFHSSNAGATFSGFNRGTTEGMPLEHTDLQLFNQVLPAPTLNHDDFRTFPSRLVVADPVHPGRVYAADVNSPVDADFNTIDAGDIFFARSDDYGATWSSAFKVATNKTNFDALSPSDQVNFLPVLNDDNDGRYLTSTQGNANEVLAGQALPALAVDGNGNLVVIWYDTRRDPADHLLDVFGTTSSDGGQNFSANYRLTDNMFDPSVAAVDAGGGLTYLGDAIGVAIAGSSVFSVWTDTRGGSQDIYFTRRDLQPPPPALNDRFEPNDAPQAATVLGEIAAERVVPRLNVTAGDNDWFQVTTAAVGDFVVTASGGPQVQVEIWDSTGTQRLAASRVVVVNGAVVGQQATVPSSSGQVYLVHMRGGAGDAAYALTLGSLTADFGTTVSASQAGSIGVGERAVYRMTAAVNGSIEVNVVPGSGAQGNFVVQVLAADGHTVLAAGDPGAGHVSVAVAAGEVVLVALAGDADGAGDFNLELTNLDQVQTSLKQTLLFPTGGKPASVASADFNRDGKPDLVMTSSNSDQVSVLLGNGDGLFQSPRLFDVGAGADGSSGGIFREPVIADLNGDGIPDLAIPNLHAADVSILLGRGDGTFQPQRRFDATASPDSLAAGDFNGDGKVDLVAVQSVQRAGLPFVVGVLMGRGDGTFAPPVKLTSVFTLGASPIRVGDFDGNGTDDLALVSPQDSRLQVWLSKGDGTFTSSGVFATGEQTREARVVDINGDGKLDLITTGDNDGAAYIMLGDGAGGFQAPQKVPVSPPRSGDNVGLVGLNVVDFNGDGQLDIVATAFSRTAHDPTKLMLVPGVADAGGNFARFGAPQRLAFVTGSGKLAAGDYNGDGVVDLALTDTNGVRMYYTLPPTVAANTTLATARNLGTVVHAVTLPQAIVAGQQDAYYTITAPTEAVHGAGDEVIDFSALFQYTQGGGLGMTLTDAVGNELGQGERFRVQVAQGQVLTLHIFGLPGPEGTPGAGVYTLDIDVLPQVVSVQAQSALPGGAATSLVLTFQGDRLDPTSAQDPSNYLVTWLGPDGKAGTADDRILQPAASDGGQAVVYDPGANVSVSSGRSYPTAVRQTVTLLFDGPVPEGSYQVELSSLLQTAALNDGEAGLLVGGNSFAGHPVVLSANGQVKNGSAVAATNLVTPGGVAANLDTIVSGTPFLTQFHDDLGALLDALLNARGDDPAVTAFLNQQIVDRFGPGVDLSALSVAVIWLDPVSIDLADAQGTRSVYNLQSSSVNNGMTRTYMETGGNVEVIVMAGLSGTFSLNIADVQPTARGGEVIFGGGKVQTVALTDAIRDGTRSFQIEMPQFGNTLVAAGQGFTGDPSTFASIAAATTQTTSAATTSTLESSSASSGSVQGAVSSLVAQALVSSVPSGGPATIGGPANDADDWLDDLFPEEDMPDQAAQVRNGGAGRGRDAGPAAPADGQLRAALESFAPVWMDVGLGALASPVSGVLGIVPALLRSQESGQAPQGRRGAATPTPTLYLAELLPHQLDAIWELGDPGDRPAAPPNNEQPAEPPVAERAPASLSALLGLTIFAVGLCAHWERDDDHRKRIEGRRRVPH